MTNSKLLLTIGKGRTFYNGLSKQIRSSFWFMICIFLQSGISMITTPIFTRIMPQEEFGMVSAFSSLQSVFEIFISLELAAASMILFTRFDKRKKEIVSALSSLELLITFTWIVLTFIFLDKISEFLQISKILCVSMVFMIMSTQIIQLWLSYKRYTYDYRNSVRVILLLATLSSVFGVIGVVFVSPTAEGRLVPFVAMNLVVAIFIYASVIRKGKIIYDKGIWRFAFTYGVPLLPHYISQFVLSSSDRLMINYLCGQKEVALYSIACSIGAMLGMFTYAINASFIPYQFQCIKSKDYNKLARVANIIFSFFAIVLIITMLFGKEIVLLFAGEKYIESSMLVIPICIGIYFSFLMQIFVKVEEYYLYKTKIVSASIICAALNIILNFVFIKIYGYYIAAYTTFVCYFLFCLIHYSFYRKVMKVEANGAMAYDIKRLSFISCSVIFSGVILAYVQNETILKYIIFSFILSMIMINRHKFINIINSCRNHE